MMSICAALCGVYMRADGEGFWLRLSQVSSAVNPLSRSAYGESEWRAMSTKELEAELEALKAAISRGVLPQLSPTVSRETLGMKGEP
jgi:hypothetical protein